MRLIHYNVHLRYVVQYVMPVDNPENKVCVTYRRGVYIFEIPLNHPHVHTIGLKDLIDATNASQLLTLSTGLNNSVPSLKRGNIYATQEETENAAEVLDDVPAVRQPLLAATTGRSTPRNR